MHISEPEHPGVPYDKNDSLNLNTSLPAFPEQPRALHLAQVTAALEEISSFYRQEALPYLRELLSAPIDTEEKADGSLVTDADLLIQRGVKESLLYSLKDPYFIVAEESDQMTGITFSDFNELEYGFVIDPVDGTANLANQIPLIASSIGVVQHTNGLLTPKGGLIFVPMTGDIFHTAGEKVLHLRGDTGRITLLETIPPSESSKKIYYHASEGNHPPAALLSQLGKHRDYGSTVLHLLYAALGKAELALTDAFLWDIAAAAAIGEALGRKLYWANDLSPIEGFREHDFRQQDGVCTFRLKELCVLCTPETRNRLVHGIQRA